MAKQKEQMSVVKKMMIALIGGLIVGIAFLLIRENVVSESTWNVINKILFQDITVEEGVGAVGIFYIVGQIFMRGLQLAIVPLVLVSLSLPIPQSLVVLQERRCLVSLDFMCLVHFLDVSLLIL